MPSPTGSVPSVPARQLANALRSWSVLRFEVTEDPSEGVDGHRWCHTPQLGLWSGAMSANGDVMVGEMRLRALMASGADALAAELDTVLGTAWDEALEAYPRRRRHRRGHLAEPRSRLAARVSVRTRGIAGDVQLTAWRRHGHVSRGSRAGRRIFSAPGTADTSTGSGQTNSPSA